MNALNPLTPDKRAADRKAYEPSMEEILASIRRIIADDQAFSQRPAEVPEAFAEPDAAPISEPEVETKSEPEAEPMPSEPMPSPVRHFSKHSDFSKQSDLAKRSDLRSEGRAPKDTAPQEWAARERAAPSSMSEPQTPAPALAALRPRPPASIAPFPVEAQFQFFKAAAMPQAVEPTPEPEPEPAHFELPKRRPEPANGVKHPVPPSLEQMAARKPVQIHPLPPEKPAAEEAPLVSPATDAAVSSSFNALIASQFMQSSDGLDDMIREMIRPMLKAWLDDNLPVLVERLVRAEIERVARGGR
ncbi:MAG: PopZ family protein [Methylovirgula sp.]